MVSFASDEPVRPAFDEIYVTAQELHHQAIQTNIQKLALPAHRSKGQESRVGLFAIMQVYATVEGIRHVEGQYLLRIFAQARNESKERR